MAGGVGGAKAPLEGAGRDGTPDSFATDFGPEVIDAGGSDGAPLLSGAAVRDDAAGRNGALDMALSASTSSISGSSSAPSRPIASTSSARFASSSPIVCATHLATWEAVAIGSTFSIACASAFASG
jgi:hypothetical protein